MTKKCNKVYGEVLDYGSTEHGLADQKGRSVGYKWSIRAIDYVGIPEGQDSYYPREDDAPVHLFELHGCPTRNGKGYGPGFNTKEFLTLEEARQAAVTRVANAFRRDAKKFTKVFA
jgi:hypothetical protein